MNSSHLDCFGLFQPCQVRRTGIPTFTRFEGNTTPCWEGETSWHGTSRKSLRQQRSSFLPVTQVEVDFLQPRPCFWRTGDVRWKSQRSTAHGTTQGGAQEKNQSPCGKPRNFKSKSQNELMATSSWNQASLWTSRTMMERGNWPHSWLIASHMGTWILRSSCSTKAILTTLEGSLELLRKLRRTTTALCLWSPAWRWRQIRSLRQGKDKMKTTWGCDIGKNYEKLVHRLVMSRPYLALVFRWHHGAPWVVLWQLQNFWRTKRSKSWILWELPSCPSAVKEKNERLRPFARNTWTG